MTNDEEDYGSKAGKYLMIGFSVFIMCLLFYVGFKNTNLTNEINEQASELSVCKENSFICSNKIEDLNKEITNLREKNLILNTSLNLINKQPNIKQDTIKIEEKWTGCVTWRDCDAIKGEIRSPEDEWLWQCNTDEAARYGVCLKNYFNQ